MTKQAQYARRVDQKAPERITIVSANVGDDRCDHYENTLL